MGGRGKEGSDQNPVPKLPSTYSGWGMGVLLVNKLISVSINYSQTGILALGIKLIF